MAVHPLPPDTAASPEADYARPGYYGPSQKPPSGFADQIRDWIDVVVRGRWWILGAVIAVGIPVALFAMFADNVYQSSARLYVEPTGSSAGEIVLSPGSEGLLQQQSPIADELYILQYAEDLALAAAEELLDRAETAEASGLSILQTPTGELPSVEQVAGKIRGYISVVQDGGEMVNAVRVTGRSHVPEEAALVANLYAEAYVDRTRSSSRASVAATRAFLQAQVDSVQNVRAQREAAVGEYMDRENAVRLDEEASNIVSQVSALEAERDQASVEAEMMTARISQLQTEISALESNLSTRLGSTADAQKRRAEELIAELERELYIQTDKPDPDPDAIADIERRISEQQAIVNRASRQVVDESIAAAGVDPTQTGLPRLGQLKDQLTAARIQLRGARSQISTLNGRISSYQSDLERIPEQSVELARLVRERETTSRFADGLEARLQDTRTAENAELGYAEIVSPADTPTRPVEPNRPKMILLGLLAGVGIGIVLAVGRDQFDQRIRRPDDIRDAGYPLLGVIPDVTPLVEEDFGGASSVEVDGKEFDTRLTALLAPTSQAAEAFRGLRTSVLFSRPDTVVQRIVVTSASPSEGKSTVSSNLATVMAQSGRRTLLIDCDLRRSRVHRLFGLNRSPGLTDFLMNRVDVGESLDLNVADGFDVLPAGSPVPNPAEHLSSRAFRDLLDSLQESYDVIVLDAPPLMVATDSVLLSTQVDATILVAAAGQTKDYELDYVHKELQYVGSHTIGVVLNRFDVTNEYGYRYQYQYRYGNRYSYGHTS